MTKKEYLESLGYKYYINDKEFRKAFTLGNIEFIVIARFEDDFTYFGIVPDEISTQKQIDFMQIVFNNVKRDFEEMQKYED